MPCNTVQTNTVNLEKCPNHDLLEVAIKNEFGQVTRNGDTFRFNGITVSNGRVTGRQSEAQLQEITSRIKQSYSREVVKFAAKRFGWATIKGADANHFQIRKG